jgi:hypothetical protein
VSLLFIVGAQFPTEGDTWNRGRCDEGRAAVGEAAEYDRLCRSSLQSGKESPLRGKA